MMYQAKLETWWFNMLQHKSGDVPPQPLEALESPCRAENARLCAEA
jgi:hypothetical protein